MQTAIPKVFAGNSSIFEPDEKNFTSDLNNKLI